MIRDEYGQLAFTEREVVDLLYANPDQDLSLLKVEDPKRYNDSVAKFFADFSRLELYKPSGIPIKEFDQTCQSSWYMPDEYKNMDIASWVLDQCTTQDQLQRCGKELLLYQERNALDLLKFLKYLVDTMRSNHLVWGVGRGSSVASYVLYLIGIHRVDSMYYDLDIEEFLK